MINISIATGVKENGISMINMSFAIGVKMINISIVTRDKRTIIINYAVGDKISSISILRLR